MMVARKCPIPWGSLPLIVALANTFTPSVVTAQDSRKHQVKSARPAEELRLDTTEFRNWLKSHGLTELLEQHIKDFPPVGDVATKLMMRDIKLSNARDPRLSAELRLAALVQANTILDELINKHATDRRRFRWMFDLAHSRTYEQAEPLFSAIVYRGGNIGSRNALLSLTTDTVTLLNRLTNELRKEFEKIDDLSVAEFETLERRGIIDEMDRLAPQVDYLLPWALLYDSVAREERDPIRAAQLNEIVDILNQQRSLLTTPHDISGRQIQSLLLMGMPLRMIHHHVAAGDVFDRALTIAERISDEVEREHIRWAVHLIHIERIRNDRDAQRFSAALRKLAKFDQYIDQQEAGNFGLKLVAALLDRSIFKRRVTFADTSRNPQEAKRYRRAAWRRLAQLSRQHINRQNEIYASVYDLIGADADPDRLDPFERAALLAGLLFDATEGGETDDRSLKQAVTIADHYLTHPLDGSETLLPEILFNAGVAEFRLNRLEAAMKRFLLVARDHPTFAQSLSAAKYSVQLGAQFARDAATSTDKPIQQLYLDSLAAIVTHHGQTDDGKYWRFYYAQLLDELGRFDSAAEQFALVDNQHERALESRYFELRCRARVLQSLTRADRPDLLTIRSATTEFQQRRRAFATLLHSQLHSESSADSSPEQNHRLTDLLARTMLVDAEVGALAHVGKAGDALASLEGFEQRFADHPSLRSQLWRVRLLAYEQLGRLDEATAAIPAYVQADPQNAGPTLQSLYVSINDERENARRKGDDESAHGKAEVALVLALQVKTWAKDFTQSISASDRRAIDVQLAEANLNAQRNEQARELFAALMTEDANVAGSGHTEDRRVILGYARALYQLEQYADALPLFNQLATQLSTDDPLRWEALLHDLRCRTALKQSPGDVIKVIQQQQYLHPKLGGPATAPQLESLLRENERRRDEG